MTRRKMTAFTFKVTLSRVMMSCGGTSSASWRRRDSDHAVNGSKYQNHARALCLAEQPAKTKNDAALVLRQDLDGTQNIDNNNDDDNSN